MFFSVVSVYKNAKILHAQSPLLFQIFREFLGLPLGNKISRHPKITIPFSHEQQHCIKIPRNSHPHIFHYNPVYDHKNFYPLLVLIRSTSVLFSLSSFLISNSYGQQLISPSLLAVQDPHSNNFTVQHTRILLHTQYPSQ